MYKIRIFNTDYNISKRVYYHIEGLLAENRVLSSEIRAYEDNEKRLRKDIDTYQKTLDEVTSEKMDLEEKINEAIAIYDECVKTQDFSTCDLEMYLTLKEENNETLDTNTK